MLSGFPQTQDADALMMAFEIGCEKITADIICDVAKRYIQGSVERDSHRFAPSVPEFVRVCETRQSFEQAKLAPPAQVLQFPKSRFREEWDLGRYPQTSSAHREKVRKAMEGKEAGFSIRTGDENAG